MRNLLTLCLFGIGLSNSPDALCAQAADQFKVNESVGVIMSGEHVEGSIRRIDADGFVVDIEAEEKYF